MEKEIKDEYIIIYAAIPHSFLHAVLVPEINIDKETIQDIVKWSHNPFSTWGLSCSSEKISIEEPLAGAGSDTLKYGEQIIFARSFEGHQKRKTYYEVNQKIAHVLDIHFVMERNAWCRLDAHGNLEDIIKIIEIESFPEKGNGTVIVAKKIVLGEYAGVENQQLIRMYDFSRYKSKDFSGWNGSREEFDLNDTPSMFGTLTTVKDSGSYSRGFQLINIKLSKEQIISTIMDIPSEELKQYCTFIADDWKNKVISEISCAPDCISNYFTESSLPYELTPAFFNPEVLLKYKSDRTKYQLGYRSISCRGAWNLSTFDVNSAGQVHTYLLYLSYLPYEEQLHWKQFNEQPKAPLSDRAIKTDFDGEFYEEYDSLNSLKNKLEKIHIEDVPWWKLRDKEALDKVHYPYTTSRDEWAEEILNLDQVLIEGLEEKWLRKKAKKLGLNPDNRLRSLKLLEIILIEFGFEKDHAHDILSSFHTVHHLRSVLKGHTLGTDAEKIRVTSLTNFGSFTEHYSNLCKNCDESLEIIVEALTEQ